MDQEEHQKKTYKILKKIDKNQIKINKFFDRHK